MREEELTTMEAGKIRTSIADRLASLQTHGEEDWRRRVHKLNPDRNPALDILNSNVGGRCEDNGNKDDNGDRNDDEDDGTVKLRHKKPPPPSHLSAAAASDSDRRPGSIVDRLSKLQVAQNNWQVRVGEKDASRFTVAGKMRSEEAETTTAKTTTTTSERKEDKKENVKVKVVTTAPPAMRVVRGRNVLDMSELAAEEEGEETEEAR